MTGLPVTMAFNEALDVAASMPGWTVGASDIDPGRIEASQHSRWFRLAPTISSSGSSSTRRETESTCAPPAARVGVTTE
jgi:hypothetical protein